MASRPSPAVRFGGATVIPARRQSRPPTGWIPSPLGDDPGRANKTTPPVPQHIIPARKTNRLVLLPSTTDKDAGDDDGQGDVQDDFDRFASTKQGPRPDHPAKSDSPGPKTKSYAERLPKTRRADKIARVTAYCTAQAYKLKPMADFVRTAHMARTKLYDDCLYCVYHLPLLDGERGRRIKSGPVLKNHRGRAILDDEIESNERRDYDDGYFGNDENTRPDSGDGDGNRDSDRNRHTDRHADGDKLKLGEVFVFSYGVAVFWNFSAPQEKNILADIAFSASDTGVAVAVRPQAEDEIETEQFNFEYSRHIRQPRVFNDMITLRSRDHMVKLAIAHALAQSTKLCFFEERMAKTMNETVHVPRVLAKTGRLGMRRPDVIRTLGRLFRNRVDVNLSSNVLDVPKFFWDTEPTLHPLYTAVREYLEIGPRIQVLNERCQVFLDLAAVLSDTLAQTKMSALTWAIIVLIVVSIMVTISEVVLRFAILTRSGS